MSVSISDVIRGGERVRYGKGTGSPDLRPRADQGPAHPPDRVLAEGPFGDALFRERKRAERLGSRFAVVVVTREGTYGPTRPWGSILLAVAAAKRDIDIEGWLERGAALGLLMPDITSDGAHLVVRRLRQQIAERLGERSLAALSIHLYGLVTPGDPGSRLFSPVDSLLDAFPSPRHLVRDAVKRAFDMLASSLLLALFAPVMLAVFAAVKWTSPGPALYRQVRVGQRGRPFTMLKFRTMYADAGHGIHKDYVSWFITSSGRQPRSGNEVFKLTNDPRITRVGCLLRKTSLDELPQFWNVLRGEMSLVGPRPPLPFEVEQYQPWHRRRILEAKPGVTGPWQVYGRSRTTFDEMVRLDLHYARTHSLWTDIKILAATPAAMISGKGAC